MVAISSSIFFYGGKTPIAFRIFASPITYYPAHLPDCVLYPSFRFTPGAEDTIFFFLFFY